MEEECRECKEWKEYCRKSEEHFYWDHVDATKMHFSKSMTGDFSTCMVIPKKFIDHFKGELLETIELKVPSGDKWHVELKKTSYGVVLECGWKNFVAAHDIKENDFLVFKYDGSSSFLVLMFEQGGCEKASSHCPNKWDHMEFAMNSGKLMQSCHGSSAISTEQARPSTFNMSRLRAKRNVKEKHSKKKLAYESSPRSTEQVRSSSIAKRIVKGNHSRRILNSIRNCRRINSRRKKPSNDQENEIIEVEGTENLTNEVSNSKQQSDPLGTFISSRAHLTDTEKKRLLSLTKMIQTDKPSFTTIMVPCSISKRFYVSIPIAFAVKFLPRVSWEVLLQLPDKEKSWSVKCLVQMNGVGFSTGWKEFAQDNKLKLGDICLFEPLEIKECKTMIVHISAVEEEDMLPLSQM